MCYRGCLHKYTLRACTYCPCPCIASERWLVRVVQVCLFVPALLPMLDDLHIHIHCTCVGCTFVLLHILYYLCNCKPNTTTKTMTSNSLYSTHTCITAYLSLCRCRNCGSASHRSWECTEQQNVTSSVICSRCGGGGHIASDCMVDL